MDVRTTVRDTIKYRAGALCLIGILASTYLHSTAFMSQFFYHSIILGGIAAFAIDAGVVAMSIFKDELLKDGQLAWMVRVVTVCVLFTSGIANMAEGFKSAYGMELAYSTLSNLDPLTWVQWLAGTIIFPILAYVMCDTIGTRNLVELKKQQEARDRVSRPRQTAPRKRKPAAAVRGTADVNGSTRSLNAANATIQRNKQERMRLLEDYIDRNPDATLNEMAEVVGVSSRETVRKYLTEMGHQANISRN